MIKPLQIKNKIFPINIIQGPLAGISSAPFRSLIWQYGQPAFSCTEMISCKTLIYQAKSFHHRFVKKDIAEGPVSFQLAGSDPVEIAHATQIVTDYGAELIDLNCGCPVNKIRRKGAGSSLLTNPSQLYKLICAMKQNTHVPVSIKIRVEGNSKEKFNREIAKVVSEAGVDFLIVHGRHWTEHYETHCHHDEIIFFVNQLTIPVIGNGDVACIDSLKKMLATGCAGVMIARASVGQPWLIRKLIAEIHQEKFPPPSIQEIGSIFITHVQKLAELLNNEKFAVLNARKFAKYYARTLLNKAAFSVAINKCDNLSDLKDISARYFL